MNSTLKILALSPLVLTQLASAQTNSGNTHVGFSTYAYCKTYVNTVQNKDYYNVQIGYSNQTNTAYFAPNGQDNFITPNGYTTSPALLPETFFAMTISNHSATVLNVAGNVNLTWHVKPTNGSHAEANTSPNHVEELPNCGPLPVELTVFSAAASTQDVSKVALSWNTASEKNSDRFEIETSSEGVNFAIIGSVKGSGTSTSSHDYGFVTQSMMAGTHYFRLKQIDMDGTTAYSPVQMVRTRMGVLQTSVYPNPSNGSDFIQLSIGGSEPAVVEMMNSVGVVIMKFTATAMTTIPTAGLSAGEYFMRTTASNAVKVDRVIIK